MKKTLTIIVMLALVGCAAPLIKPTQTDVDRANQQWAGTSLADLQKGRTIYSQNCGKCHKLYDPKQFSAKKWEHELAAMRNNAPSVSNDEYALLKKFVLTMREATSKN